MLPRAQVHYIVSANCQTSERREIPASVRRNVRLTPKTQMVVTFCYLVTEDLVAWCKFITSTEAEQIQIAPVTLLIYDFDKHIHEMMR